ncbi:hypothetical protein BT96DRAFT_1007040 [Gymnopus androsaceus JB14]|uniref:Uncharacterized protein n=1 Tax=Gymnopus androsaceus JB14 TaxID=1447944 RepID=A0A6A4GJF5_9AGAR|nr:hypothetical protein BT96DRAFT_1007040 [Gymnopus androsaceus JB14]
MVTVLSIILVDDFFTAPATFKICTSNLSIAAFGGLAIFSTVFTVCAAPLGIDLTIHIQTDRPTIDPQILHTKYHSTLTITFPNTESLNTNLSPGMPIHKETRCTRDQFLASKTIAIDFLNSADIKEKLKLQGDPEFIVDEDKGCEWLKGPIPFQFVVTA